MLAQAEVSTQFDLQIYVATAELQLGRHDLMQSLWRPKRLGQQSTVPI